MRLFLYKCHLLSFLIFISIAFSCKSQIGKNIFDSCKAKDQYVIIDSLMSEKSLVYNKFYRCKCDSTIKLLEYYNSTGNLYSDVISSKNSPKAIVRFYNSDIITSITEMENGERNGEYLTYFDNGIIAIKGNYKNDKESGIWYYYDELGKLIKTKEW